MDAVNVRLEAVRIAKERADSHNIQSLLKNADLIAQFIQEGKLKTEN